MGFDFDLNQWLKPKQETKEKKPNRQNNSAPSQPAPEPKPSKKEASSVSAPPKIAEADQNSEANELPNAPVPIAAPIPVVMTPQIMNRDIVRLQEDLQEGGGTVERVTITPAAPADGKPLSDVPLPESVRIVVIRRGDALLLPTGNLVLKAGDQVTIIGDRSAVPGALQSLRA